MEACLGMLEAQAFAASTMRHLLLICSKTQTAADSANQVMSYVVGWLLQSLYLPLVGNQAMTWHPRVTVFDHGALDQVSLDATG